MYLIKTLRSPFYEVIFPRNGKRTTISTKTALKSDALKFLNEFEKKIQKEEIKPSFFLKAFQDEYLEFMRPTKSKNYFRSVKLSFRKFIEFTGNIELRNIDFRLVEKFISFTYQRSESGADSYYRILKAAFNKAESWNYIERNPFVKVKLPKMKTKLPVYLSEDQFSFLLGFIRDTQLKDFYSILFFTGLRAGELCNLQISNIDLTERILKVSNSATFSTKSKKERIIPLNDITFEILKNRLPKVCIINRKHYIFYRIDSTIPLTVDYVSKQFKKAVRLSGLNPSLHLHSTRHSFCSNLVNANVSLYTVQQLAGHSSSKTTAIYAHSNNSSLRDAVNLLNNHSQIKIG